MMKTDLKSSLLQNLAILLASAVLFFLVSYPFTMLGSYFVISEVRLSGVLNPCFGFVFGPIGALGCALGNFVCDWITVDPIIALRGFPFQFLYGLIPYLLLQVFPISKDEKRFYRFTHVKHVLLFHAAAFAACLFIASMLALFFATGSQRRELFVFILLNNLSVCFIFGMPLVLLLVRIKRRMQRLPEVENVGIGEMLLLYFMLVQCACVLLAGALSYFQMAPYQQGVALWDGVFFAAFLTSLVFAILQVVFLLFIEKRVLIPLNHLAGLWQKDRKLAVDTCNELYNSKSEIGELSRAFLGFVDEIQVNLLKASRAKTQDNGVSDLAIFGDKAKLLFFGSLEAAEANELAINLAQIPQSCTSLEIDTEAVTFISGELLRKLSQFIEEREGFRVILCNVGDSTRTILDITGYSELFEVR